MWRLCHKTNRSEGQIQLGAIQKVTSASDTEQAGPLRPTRPKRSHTLGFKPRPPILGVKIPPPPDSDNIFRWKTYPPRAVSGSRWRIGWNSGAPPPSTWTWWQKSHFTAWLSRVNPWSGWHVSDSVLTSQPSSQVLSVAAKQGIQFVGLEDLNVLQGDHRVEGLAECLHLALRALA